MEWNARVWFGSFFLKMIVSIHRGVCEDIDCIGNDIDKTKIVDIDLFRNSVLKNS